MRELSGLGRPTLAKHVSHPVKFKLWSNVDDDEEAESRDVVPDMIAFQDINARRQGGQGDGDFLG